MSISCGFYNSVNGDRRYGSPQMSALFDGVINDGVFMHVGGALMTTPGSGMSVIVAPGRAWFDHTWTYNDSDYPITISPAEVVLNRIDAIVLETNSSNEVRNNTIKVVKGAPASSAKKPALTNTDEVHQHPLAYVKVNAGVSSITGGDIEIMVGKTECPFVTAILETTDITALMNEWQSQFDKWFANVEYTLSGDAAGKLQVQIDGVRNDLDAYTPYKIGDIKISALPNTDPSWALCNGDPVDLDTYPELKSAPLWSSFSMDITNFQKLYDELYTDGDKPNTYVIAHTINKVIYILFGTVTGNYVIFYKGQKEDQWKVLRFQQGSSYRPRDFWVHEKTLMMSCTSNTGVGLYVRGYSNIDVGELDISKSDFSAAGSDVHVGVRYSEKDQCWLFLHYSASTDKLSVYLYTVGASNPSTFAYQNSFYRSPIWDVVDGTVYAIGVLSSSESALYELSKSQSTLVGNRIPIGSNNTITWNKFFPKLLDGVLFVGYTNGSGGQRYFFYLFDMQNDGAQYIRTIEPPEFGGLTSGASGFYVIDDILSVITYIEKVSELHPVILEYSLDEFLTRDAITMHMIGSSIAEEITWPSYNMVQSVDQSDDYVTIVITGKMGGYDIAHGFIAKRLPLFSSNGAYYYIKVKEGNV